jgi:hypothetical protein
MRDQKGWNNAKSGTLFRDRHECQLCGYTSDLEIHHIIPYKFCQHHKVWNLITLCTDCHDLVSDNKYYIYNYKNRENQEKYTEKLKNIINSDENTLTKLNKLQKWSKLKRNKSKTNELIRIIKYLKILIRKNYIVNVHIYCKGNKDVKLIWEVEK